MGKKPYRGWLVFAGAFVNTMIVVGSTAFAFSLFIVPVAKEFSLSRADVNNGLIAMLVGFAVWGPIVGRVVDRIPAGVVHALGGVMFALGFLTISLSHSLWLICLAAFGPIAIGAVCAGILASNAVVSRWFRRRRGRALAFLGVSASAGGLLMTPLIGFLIANYGWRMALGIVGVGAPIAITLSALFLLRSRPTEAELASAGELRATTATPVAVANEHKWTLRELLTLPNFWLIAFGMGLLYASDQAVLATKGAYLHDLGASVQMAAFFVSVQTISSVTGKFVIGFLADSVPLKNLFYYVVAMHVAYLVLFIVQPSYWVLLGSVLIVGVGIGGMYPIYTTMIASHFGSASYGTVMGWMEFVKLPLTVVSLRLIGESYDRSGSYDFAFFVFLGAIAVSVPLIAAVRSTPSRAEDAADTSLAKMGERA